MTVVQPMRSTKVLMAIGVWFVLALTVGASGLLANERIPLPPVFVIGSVVVLFLLFWLSSGFRGWALGVDVRWLIGIHLARFVGIYFLVLYSWGELPYAFAVPGGWGDIIAAATALAVLLSLPSLGAWSRPVLLVWNLFGLVDILGVVATASRLRAASPESVQALLRLPLSLLSTFLVPIIIFTHIVIFTRLLRSRKDWGKRIEGIPDYERT